MARLLLLAVVVLAIYLLIRSFSKQPHRDKASQPAQDMVRCVHCGVHLPKGESIVAGGNYYCCEAHRRANSGSPNNPDAG